MLALEDVLPLLRLRVEDADVELILAADAGEPQAACELALLFLEQDLPAAALPWLEHGAKRFYPEAMYWLGRCLIAGRGAEAAEAAGIRWIGKAAQQGHAIAARMLRHLDDPARPRQSAAGLDASLDAIEREIVMRALRETADAG